MRVLVVVVLYNGEQYIGKCLESLFASECDLDVICIDNGSIDCTCSIVKNDFSNVILVENKFNLGFGAANNIGLKYSVENEYDFVFLLNQDCVVQPNTILLLIHASSNYSEFGVLSPLHLNGEGSNLDLKFSEYIKEYNCIGLISDSILGRKQKEIYEVSFVNAAAWLLPISVVKRIGGFDPIFFHYGEDDNYCQRLTYHGFKIGIVPRSLVYHDRLQTLITENIYKDFASFERYLKVKLGDICNEDIDVSFSREIGKIKTRFYASLATFQFREAVLWKKYIDFAWSLKGDILKSRAQGKNEEAVYLDK